MACVAGTLVRLDAVSAELARIERVCGRAERIERVDGTVSRVCHAGTLFYLRVVVFDLLQLKRQSPVHFRL